MYPTLYNPMDCRLPDSFVHGILQARILEWVAMDSSRGSFQPKVWTGVFYISCIGRLFLFYFSFLFFFFLLLAPPIENSIEVSHKTQNRTTMWQSNSTHGYIFGKKGTTVIWKDSLISIFRVELFTIAKIWKEPNYPSIDEWIKKCV